MIKRLKDIAFLQTGYTFRSGIAHLATGNIGIIQMKDLTDDNIVDITGISSIFMEGIKDNHLARKGDLIFRSRGVTNTSAIILDNPGEALVAAPLIRIRVKNKKNVLPEYLNWYINQKEAQEFIASRPQGSAQKMIRKQTLEEMDIILPDFKKQKQIVELFNLLKQEQFLLYRIAEKRDRYISTLLMQYAKENN